MGCSCCSKGTHPTRSSNLPPEGPSTVLRRRTFILRCPLSKHTCPSVFVASPAQTTPPSYNCSPYYIPTASPLLQRIQRSRKSGDKPSLNPAEAIAGTRSHLCPISKQFTFPPTSTYFTHTHPNINPALKHFPWSRNTGQKTKLDFASVSTPSAVISQAQCTSRTHLAALQRGRPHWPMWSHAMKFRPSPNSPPAKQDPR